MNIMIVLLYGEVCGVFDSIEKMFEYENEYLENHPLVEPEDFKMYSWTINHGRS